MAPVYGGAPYGAGVGMGDGVAVALGDGEAVGEGDGVVVVAVAVGTLITISSASPLSWPLVPLCRRNVTYTPTRERRG